jgi:hypothetical protein
MLLDQRELELPAAQQAPFDEHLAERTPGGLCS